MRGDAARSTARDVRRAAKHTLFDIDATRLPPDFGAARTGTRRYARRRAAQLRGVARAAAQPAQSSGSARR